MKGLLIILTGALLFGCSAIKIKHADNDSSLLFQNDSEGQIWLSSLNSGQQINITEIKNDEDTLIISYKRGVFISPNNIIPLNSKTKYLKCANKLYFVELNGVQYKLTEIE